MSVRPPAQKFEDLIVWQKSHKLTLKVYKLTRQFPREETFGSVSQMRRAAVSVSANIAEGFGRSSRSDKARVLNLGLSSLDELRYFFILARDLGYIAPGSESDEAAEVGRLLTASARTLASPAPVSLAPSS
jgi:four helix bundle protein